MGEKGRLPLYTYDSRREYGRAQAITRKGALGIRLWLCYHPSYARAYRHTLLSFLRPAVRLGGRRPLLGKPEGCGGKGPEGRKDLRDGRPSSKDPLV